MTYLSSVRRRNESGGSTQGHAPVLTVDLDRSEVSRSGFGSATKCSVSFWKLTCAHSGITNSGRFSNACPRGAETGCRNQRCHLCGPILSRNKARARHGTAVPTVLPAHSAPMGALKLRAVLECDGAAQGARGLKGLAGGSTARPLRCAICGSVGTVDAVCVAVSSWSLFAFRWRICWEKARPSREPGLCPYKSARPVLRAPGLWNPAQTTSGTGSVANARQRKAPGSYGDGVPPFPSESGDSTSPHALSSTCWQTSAPIARQPARDRPPTYQGWLAQCTVCVRARIARVRNFRHSAGRAPSQQLGILGAPTQGY
jgi:hypothetical protein